MARPRVDLHELLRAIAGHVYFQPPSNTRLEYPCIIYKRDDEHAEHADNVLYRHLKRYEVTVIDEDPDSTLPDEVRALPYCSFARFYPADKLNHDVFHLFF